MVGPATKWELGPDGRMVCVDNGRAGKCFVLTKGDGHIVAVTISENDAMDWAVSEIEGSNWIEVQFNPDLSILIEQEVS